MTRSTRLHPDASSSEAKSTKRQQDEEYYEEDDDVSDFDVDDESQEATPRKKKPTPHTSLPATNNNNNNNSTNNSTNNTTGEAAAAAGAEEEEEVQLPQFIASLHELISDRTSDHVVCWLPLPDGRFHFVVKDVEAFTQNILPKYYRTHKMTSFMRQLNNYGFSKVKSTDQNDKTYEFEHEHNLLQPHRPDLLFKIERRRTAKRGGGSVSNAAKRSRTGQNLFRITTAVPTNGATSSPVISPRLHTLGGATSFAAAGGEVQTLRTQLSDTIDHERDLEKKVATLQARLDLQNALLARATNAPLGAVTTAADEDDDNDHSASGPAGAHRPRRSASVAARSAIKAAVQDIDDGEAEDVFATAGGAADESSEFDESPTASFDQQPSNSMSQTALAQRRQEQLNRLRLHEEKMSLARVSTPPISTGFSLFAVPQQPASQQLQQQQQQQPTFAFGLAQTPTAQNQQGKMVVQARLGLTKSGEVWKSMIQSAVVEPTQTAAATGAGTVTLFDMPRSNSNSDFFGLKRDASVDALDTEFADTGLLLDDTRGFLKSSTNGVMHTDMF